MSKFDIIENNMLETFNGIFVEAWYKPIVQLLEEIRIIMIRRIVARRAYVSKFKRNFGP